MITTAPRAVPASRAAVRREAVAAQTSLAVVALHVVDLIHAGHGQGGESLNPRFFEAAGEPKLLWTIPEAGHTGGIEARPAEYERRMIAFFDQTLLDRD